MPRARLVDVAEHAGVSVMTVSNVVNKRASVAPALRERVEASIAQLGYHPHAGARQLVTGRTNTIAIAIPEVNVPYFAELARILAGQASQLGYRVITEQTVFGPEEEWAVLQQYEQGIVDGLLFHPITIDTEQLAEISPDLPVVLLGEVRPPANLDHVMIDNVASARCAVEHLVRNGRRRVAFLGTEGERPTQANVDRAQGWREALLAAGLEAGDELVLHITGYTAKDGYRAGLDALERGLEFDALLCRDDLLAFGAMRALHDAGRQVPQDVAVIGWDDTWPAAFTHPSLTSVSPDKAELAHVALDLLLRRIDGGSPAAKHVLTSAHLAIRESAP